MRRSRKGLEEDSIISEKLPATVGRLPRYALSNVSGSSVLAPDSIARSALARQHPA